GPNDSSLMRLSTCNSLDFRPTLQAAAAVARGERLYDAGPWDEEALWWMGTIALDLPLRPAKLVSRSFPESGFHVLRSRAEGTFATMRCGTQPNRFGDMDMLHVDVWWNGFNICCDAGTYSYVAPLPWLRYFIGTRGHNTIMVDDRDQMVFFRRFKYLYP